MKENRKRNKMKKEGWGKAAGRGGDDDQKRRRWDEMVGCAGGIDGREEVRKKKLRRKWWFDRSQERPGIARYPGLGARFQRRPAPNHGSCPARAHQKPQPASHGGGNAAGTRALWGKAPDGSPHVPTQGDILALDKAQENYDDARLRSKWAGRYGVLPLPPRRDLHRNGG